MGYSYSARTGGICCDNCGVSGGVRKRTCPHKVLGSSHRTADGQRHALPWCPAPAYCSPCFKARGGSKGVHADCAAGAAESQARADAEQARLDAGEQRVSVAYGSWHDDVPEGKALVGFQAAGSGSATWLLIPSEEYDPSAKPWASDYPTAAVVTGPRPLSKAV